jgi:ABC-2 type transport system ATP-binding protein
MTGPIPALDVRHLCKRYGTVKAVDDLSFAVNHGEIVGLVGENGAGKTTTISMVLGVLEPSSGAIEIDGIDLARQRSKALAHANFAAIYAPLPGNLTVSQNLRYFGFIYDVADSSTRIETLIEQFDLQTLRNTKSGLLSSGEQTRLTLAKALINQPRLLLLDEPTASLDPSAAAIIRTQIHAMAKQAGCGILWTSHNMYEVAEVCDRVLFLSHGKIVLQGDPKTLPEEHGASTLEELFIRFARAPLPARAEPAR